jgi:RNA polymerase sigma factor (sigma-70 family)
MIAEVRDDAALAKAARRGEDRAFTELMRRHKGPLYRFVSANLGDADEAYDVLQDAFVAAWGALASYDPKRPFAAWLRRIALNKCRDWARKRRVRRFFYRAANLDDPAVQQASQSEPEQTNALEESLSALDAAVAALPQGLKEPLILTAIDGLSHAEAGALLGLSAKAVEMRVYRAKKALASMAEHTPERDA